MKSRLPGMRVFVTGGAGFAGIHLVRALLHVEAKPVAWLHERDLPPDLRHCEVVSGDVSRISDVMLSCDAVCHAAAYVPPDLEDSHYASACFENNALLTLNIAECISRKPEIKLVYFSLGQGYVVSRGAAARESDPMYPTRAPFYLGSKLLGEIYVEHCRRQKSLPWYSLRIGSMYGSGMRASSVPAHFIERAIEGVPLRVLHGGIPECDFVHVSDVVSATLSALQSGEPGIYNVGSGRATTLLQLAETIIDVFASQSEIQVVPASGAIPSSFAALDSSKPRSTWGYKPLDLRAGLMKEKNALAVSA